MIPIVEVLDDAVIAALLPLVTVPVFLTLELFGDFVALLVPEHLGVELVTFFLPTRRRRNALWLLARCNHLSPLAASIAIHGYLLLKLTCRQLNRRMAQSRSPSQPL